MGNGQPNFFSYEKFLNHFRRPNVSHYYDKSTFLVKGWGWHVQLVPLDSDKGKESNEPIQSLKKKSSIFLILLFLLPKNSQKTFESYISNSDANATMKIIIMTFWLAFCLKPFNLFAYTWLFLRYNYIFLN